MRLEWAVYAIEDRVAIFEYIEADNPAAAAALLLRVTEVAVVSLLDP